MTAQVPTTSAKGTHTLITHAHVLVGILTHSHSSLLHRSLTRTLDGVLTHPHSLTPQLLTYTCPGWRPHTPTLPHIPTTHLQVLDGVLTHSHSLTPPPHTHTFRMASSHPHHTFTRAGWRPHTLTLTHTPTTHSHPHHSLIHAGWRPHTLTCSHPYTPTAHSHVLDGVLKQHEVHGSIDLIVRVESLLEVLAEGVPGGDGKVLGLPDAHRKVAVD